MREGRAIDVAERMFWHGIVKSSWQIYCMQQGLQHELEHGHFMKTKTHSHSDLVQRRTATLILYMLTKTHSHSDLVHVKQRCTVI